MNNEESLLWRGTPSQWINFGTYFFCLLMVAADLAAYFLTSWGPLVLTGLVLPLLWAISAWAKVRSRVYEITTERIRVSSGVVSRITTELELYRVRDYTIREPLALRMLGCGDLILSTADRSNPLLVLHAIPKVAVLKDQIRQNTERMRQLRGVRDLEVDPPAPAFAAFLMAALLELDKVTIRFGGLTAVNGVNFVVGENELCGLIGPNGAGKTTVFNLITGVYQPTEGMVRFAGNSVAGLRVNEIVARGIARTFQNIRLFEHLSVFDNVRAACNLHRETGAAQALVRMKSFREDESQVRVRVNELLGIFNLRRFGDAPAKSLPYGEQRRLEIVRCLATKPRLLLLDEPAAGMNPTEKVELIRLIQQVQKQFNLSVLLVEHSMKVVMGVCQRIAVLDYGVKIAEGSPAEIQGDRKVIEAYLGEDQADLSHH